MRKANHADLFFGLLLLAASSFFLWGIRLLPFHPDETSLLYQSRDLELLLAAPLSMAWDPTKEEELDQAYRELNPPLPKYVLGIGRSVAGFGPDFVSMDWNWSLTWEENEAAGALPAFELLKAARAASAMMLPLSMLILYLCGRALKNQNAGVIAALAFGLHALVLLHGRRAMAEGTLLFSVSLAMLSFFGASKRPWFAGLATSLAACSKLSAMALFPVGLFSALWILPGEGRSNRRAMQNGLVFIAVFLIAYLSLNPLLWSSPIQAFGALYRSRVQFLSEQVELIRMLAPNQILESPLERIAVMLAHLYLTEPQMAEVGNYLAQTAAMESAYLAQPFHNFSRGIIGGAAMLIFTGLGMAFSVLEVRSKDLHKIRRVTLLFAGTLVQSMALLWANPLPFQRYYVPLIPWICLWVGIGASFSLSAILRLPARWMGKDSLG